MYMSGQSDCPEVIQDYVALLQINKMYCLEAQQTRLDKSGVKTEKTDSAR